MSLPPRQRLAALMAGVPPNSSPPSRGGMTPWLPPFQMPGSQPLPLPPFHQPGASMPFDWYMEPDRRPPTPPPQQQPMPQPMPVQSAPMAGAMPPGAQGWGGPEPTPSMPTIGRNELERDYLRQFAENPGGFATGWLGRQFG